MRGMLSFLILFLLSKKEMNGQEITLELEKRRGTRPSPGTIYPALKSLNESKLIVERKESGMIFYSLTDNGKKAYKDAKTQFVRTFMDVL